jgi:hypothetical protein
MRMLKKRRNTMSNAKRVWIVGERFLEILYLVFHQRKDLSNWIIAYSMKDQVFKFNHLQEYRYTHYLRAVYAKCQRPTRPIDLQKVYQHIYENNGGCSRCRQEYESLKERELSFVNKQPSLASKVTVAPSA